MNYDSICYQNTCLSQVIIRLDFLDFFDDDSLFGSPVEKEILKSFPKKGMRQLMRFQRVNVTTDMNGLQTTKQTHRDGSQQEYSDTNNNRIVLSNKFIVYEINKYTTFEKIIESFERIVRILMSTSDFAITRTGIRYINFFNEDGIKPKKVYFNQSVGALLDNRAGENLCARSMGLSEFVINDMKLNFRFGMYNPDYPQIMKRMNYALDYDCYCEEAIYGYDAVISHINSGHNEIQKLFENSITDHLRRVMKNGE